jgi:hypothetical protein
MSDATGIRKMASITYDNRRKFRPGFTLIEIVMASTIALISGLVVGGLIVAGQRSWTRAFNRANFGVQADALQTMITFGSLGRKSNKMDYRVYRVEGGRFLRAVPLHDPEEVVSGQAVEFRYWDVELDSSLMDTEKTGTAYALFYVDGDQLKVDEGPYPPGGVNASGQRILSGDATTRIIAQNVETVEFSHTTRNLEGDGYGCVRMDLKLADRNDKNVITVRTATLMRNVWP